MSAQWSSRLLSSFLVPRLRVGRILQEFLSLSSKICIVMILRANKLVILAFHLFVPPLLAAVALSLLMSNGTTYPVPILLLIELDAVFLARFCSLFLFAR